MTSARASANLLMAFAGAALLGGCGSAKERQADAKVPDPPIAELLPSDYRAQEILQANLTETSVPETIVTSTGPPRGELNFRPATLQVLSWDELAKRWTVIFDGQRVIGPNTYASPKTSNRGPGFYAGIHHEDRKAILDPDANVNLGPVRFAPMLSEDRDQLIFSAALSYGGSGVPRELAVVDFPKGQAKVVYAWGGEHLVWKLRGNQIVARSSYWTRHDAHCCPSRSYRFAVGNENGNVTKIEDERPYLGVLVRELESDGLPGSLEVLEVEEKSPAATALRVGDVILEVKNAPPPSASDWAPSDSIFNKVSAFDAGETAHFVVRRDGAEFVIPVRLGSLRDAVSIILPEGDYSVDAL